VGYVGGSPPVLAAGFYASFPLWDLVSSSADQRFAGASCVKGIADWRRTCSAEADRSQHVTATSSAERTANGALVRWTEEEVCELSQSDTCLLMQMATLRSSPHDLFMIRWCAAHLRKLRGPVE
jgi:hypothetical protein